MNVEPLIDESLFKGLYSKINPAFYDRINRKKVIEEKCRSLGGAYLLYKGLKDMGIDKVKIDFTDKGKPYCDQICFNISHSGKFAACGFSDAEIGVDIQRLKNVSQGVADKIALPNEKAKLSAAKQVIRLWTRKEALAKCLGTGIGENIWNIDLTGDVVYIGGNTYGIETIPVGDYYLSVCTENEMPSAEIKKVNV